MYYVNENFKRTKRVFPEQARKEYMRLDMNENVDGLPEEFINDFLAKIDKDFISMYPEPEKFERVYSEYMGIEKNMIMPTNGSDMAIRYVFETFGENGKKVVTVIPTFEMYRINAQLMGMEHVAIEYDDDYSISVDKIIDKIDDDTRIVVILNPNNPMGNVFDEQDVRTIINRAKEKDAIVFIDEAYHYFCDTTYINLVQEYNNVVLCRTFSKMFAMAACRLGVVISNSEMIEWMKRGKLSFEVNSFALEMGSMLLERPDVIQQMIVQAKEGKEYLLELLESKGYEVRRCEGNFVFVYPKTNVKELEKRLKKNGVLIKTYSTPILENVIRVTTGSRIVMEQFAEILFRVDV